MQICEASRIRRTAAYDQVSRGFIVLGGLLLPQRAGLHSGEDANAL
jgi:hypothetical protein